MIGPYPSCDSKPGSKSKIRSACRYSHYRWGVLVARTIPRATAARRPARIVKLIRHAKPTDAAHSCPALLNSEEAAICATATTRRILGAPSSIIAGQSVDGPLRQQRRHHNERCENNFGCKTHCRPPDKIYTLQLISIRPRGIGPWSNLDGGDGLICDLTTASNKHRGSASAG